MHIHNWDTTYAGYYYYESSQQPIYFKGSRSAKSQVIQLIANWTEDHSEIFTGSFAGKSFVGNWYKSDTSKPIGFSFVPSRDTMMNAYDFIYSEGEFKLQPAWKESPQASFLSASIWPKNSNPLGEYLKTEIKKANGVEKFSGDIGKIFLEQKKDYFKSYQADMKEFKLAELKASPYMFSYDAESQMMIVYSSPSILSTALYSYSYTGGAHGMYGTTYQVFDLANKKELKVDNVLNMKDSLKLNVILAKRFREQYKLKPLQSLTEVLFEDKLSWSDNYFLTSKGIGFNYLPYEIAAFAFGEITIFIPFTELRGMLRPEFAKLISK